MAGGSIGLYEAWIRMRRGSLPSDDICCGLLKAVRHKLWILIIANIMFEVSGFIAIFRTWGHDFSTWRGSYSRVANTFAPSRRLVTLRSKAAVPETARGSRKKC